MKVLVKFMALAVLLFAGAAQAQWYPQNQYYRSHYGQYGQVQPMGSWSTFQHNFAGSAGAALGTGLVVTMLDRAFNPAPAQPQPQYMPQQMAYQQQMPVQQMPAQMPVPQAPVQQAATQAQRFQVTAGNTDMNVVMREINDFCGKYFPGSRAFTLQGTNQFECR